MAEINVYASQNQGGTPCTLCDSNQYVCHTTRDESGEHSVVCESKYSEIPKTISKPSFPSCQSVPITKPSMGKKPDLAGREIKKTDFPGKRFRLIL